ncbi:class I SAM-dependent methyltransferase [Kangiella sp.]|uniref:class I SAM-dependent methyltransferase n=1 Tax=Kangiella sp. TaxID=1920245 RepID=UPI003A9104E3
MISFFGVFIASFLSYTEFHFGQLLSLIMKHWSNYWTTSNTLNSFAESEASKGYTGAIKDYWFNVFSTLKPESRIVDIGCGNGALACLAAEYSEMHNLHFDIHGIDAADINPLQSLKSEKEVLKLLKQITFHPATPAEKLPFESKSIDMFISQFGFEYADFEQATIQCVNSLTENGTINIMAHHPASPISQDTEIGEHLLKNILHTSPLFLQVDLLLDIATQVKASGQYQSWKQNPYNQSISRTIKWILDTLKFQFNEDKHEAWLQDIFNRVIPVLQNLATEDPQKLRAHLAQQFKVLEEHRTRLEEQLKATITDTKINALEQQINGLGRSSQISPFTIDNRPFAWSISIL